MITATKMKPSKYQQDIYNHVITTNKNIVIGATAGSGKTTTLVEMAKLVPYNRQFAFIAFNKHIVKELQSRLPKNTICSTMHSLGYKCLMKHYNEVVFAPKKQIGFIEQLFNDETNQRKKWKSIYAIDQAMSLARATMTGESLVDLEVLMEQYFLDLDAIEIRKLLKAMSNFRKYNDDLDRSVFNCDFQDMVAQVTLHPEIVVPQYDYVAVDEVQDLSALDRIFVNRLVKPVTGRKFLCGDRRQAIYSFRGADIRSFDQFEKDANSITLPLTVSYRCAKAIVREAKKVYPEIEENPDNEEGEVRVGSLDEIREGDMVLCRNTRPLIDVLLHLIELEVPAYIVGKDMEKGLLGIISGVELDAKTDDVWLELKNREEERVKKELSMRNVKNFEKHPKFGALQEKLSIIFVLFMKFTYVYEVEQFIQMIFEDDDREGARLMTIHKSKGLENDRVFVVKKFDGKELIPSQYAISADQLTAEANLEFVSITRAKKELIYLNL